MKSSFAHTLRLFRLVWTLSRHGALFPLDAFDLPKGLVGLLRLLERRSIQCAQGNAWRRPCRVWGRLS